jgi:pentatricopeptide repeat protein
MPTIHMFNTILKSFIDQNRLDDANKLWIRMHLEQCSLDKEAFTTMLRTCTKTGQFNEIEIQN